MFFPAPLTLNADLTMTIKSTERGRKMIVKAFMTHQRSVVVVVVVVVVVERIRLVDSDIDTSELGFESQCQGGYGDGKNIQPHISSSILVHVIPVKYWTDNGDLTLS